MNYEIEKGENYKKLARIVQFMQIGSPIQLILNNGYDVNYAVPSGSLQYFTSQWLGYTALHFAVEKNLIIKNRNALIDQLLRKGADFTLVNQRGFTPLRLALECFIEDTHANAAWDYDVLARDMIDQLLLAHITFNNATNSRSNDDLSHFHIACIIGNLKVAEFFLKAGVPVNEPIGTNASLCAGYTALHIAMRNKDEDMVQLLVGSGADYNYLNAEGLSPLELIDNKQLESDLFSKIEMIPFAGEASKNKWILRVISKTSLHIFPNPNRVQLSKLQIYCINCHGDNELEDLNELLNDNENINAAVNFRSRIWPGYTALHFAAHSNLKIFQMLLKNGANPWAKNAESTTPLDLVLKYCDLEDIIFILDAREEFKLICFDSKNILVNVLRELQIMTDKKGTLKVDPNVTISSVSPLWPCYSLLHVAVILSQKDDCSLVALCLELGVDLTIQNTEKMTALHLAFYKKKWACVKTILNAHTKESANPVDKNNLSHFHISCLFVDLITSKHFLESGEDPNIPVLINISSSYHDINCRCEKDQTIKIVAGSACLHIATAHRSLELAALLLEFKANPHIPDSNGFTCLHLIFMQEMNTLIQHQLINMYLDDLKENLVTVGGLSYLHVAFHLKYKKIIEKLLPQVINVNEPITEEFFKHLKDYELFPRLSDVRVGDTLLHIAAKTTMVDEINVLLNKGANMKLKNKEGLNPLHIALLENGARNLMKIIIQNLASAWEKVGNWPDEEGLTRLHVACVLNDLPLIKKLLEDKDQDVYRPINIDSSIWPGSTPLQILIRNSIVFEKSGEAIEFLLNHILKNVENPKSADEEAPAKRQRLDSSESPRFINLEGLTAFHVSCMGSDPEIVKKFVESGADINAPQDYFAVQNRWFKTHFTCGDGGFAPLHFAAKYGGEAVIKTLIQYGADYKLENTEGHTPLEVAVINNFENFKTLFSLCEEDIEIKNNVGHTYMELLCKNRNGNFDNFLRLFELGAHQSMNPRTTICVMTHWARTFKKKDVVPLVQCLPNINDSDNHGCNFIHHIFNRDLSNYLFFPTNLIRNIDVIVTFGCDINHKDETGRTPLHKAISSTCAEKVRLLLLLGADINILNNDRESPYMYFFNTRSTIDKAESRNAIFNILSNYIDKLVTAGLYLCIQNKRCLGAQRLFVEFDNNHLIEDLRKFNEMKIKWITWRSLLTEKMVMEFPLLTENEQREVVEVYESIEFRDGLNEKFPDWEALFMWQFRRMALKKKAFEGTLLILRQFLEPEVLQVVFQNLRNSIQCDV